MKFVIALLFALNSSFALGSSNESRCEIAIVIVNIQQFSSRGDSDRFCDPFIDFCSIRRFGERQWESSFRYRHSFFGENRRNAWDQYHDFIGRNRFNRPGFNHSFQFRGGC